MKIIDGIKSKGRPVKIPDCSRNDLPEFFKQMDYKVGAEIGVYKGEYTKKFLDVGLKMYGIDPWMAYENFLKHPSEGRYKNRGPKRLQARLDFLYKHTQKVLKKYLDNGLCTLIRKMSMEALDEFEDGSLDFVYIDGNHDFRYFAEDLAEWTKKVRKGGVVSGHDFLYSKIGSTQENRHVAHVLEAYIGAYNIPNWYLLGSDKIIPGENRDKWRSWMFFK
jgi:hypothetical protein